MLTREIYNFDNEHDHNETKPSWTICAFFFLSDWALIWS
jgi:hypothetical protein